MIDDFIEWYLTLNRFRKNKFEKLALHKPLTLIYALKLCLERLRWIDYTQHHEELNQILSKFSFAKSKKTNCLYPLVRLLNDNRFANFWISEPVIKEEDLNKSGDLSKKSALDKSVKFGFSDEIYRYFQSQPNMVIFLIQEIVKDNFTDSLYEEVLDKLNLSSYHSNINLSIPLNIISTKINKRKRDPKFRINVMEAYDYKCSVCGLSLNLSSQKIPMEAAHIRWFAQGGTCDVSNGLSLCPTHHFSFDRGLWSLSPDPEMKFMVSSQLVTSGDNFFVPYVGKSIRDSVLQDEFLPDLKNISWHYENLFVNS